jgi:two-component system, NtrC family, response regulator AtoC
MPAEKIMIVDDERLVRWSLRQKCEEWGYHVIEADAGEPGLKLAQRESPDLVLLDVRMPDLTGIEVLDQLKKNGDARAVIMITADPQLDDVKAALKLGAYDFIGKPVDFDELHITIKNALEATSLRTEVQALRGEVRGGAGYNSVVGVSAKMIELMNFVRKVAASEATTILIQGESGTGKDLIAKAIHYESSRKDRPFVAINCSAIPETLMEAELFGHEKGAFTDAKQMKKGLFEAADGGTLFLDELASTSPAFQASLLRVLQSGEVRRVGATQSRRFNVRVIGASNAPLRGLVAAGSFRADLFYRLSVLSIELPPLRARTGDVELLAGHFLQHFRNSDQPPLHLTREAMEALAAHNFPGNVRELENALRRAVALSSGGLVTIDCLPPEIAARRQKTAGAGDGPQHREHRLIADRPTMEELQRRYLQLILEETGWNRRRAAAVLALDRRTIQRLIARYQLQGSIDPEGELEVEEETAERPLDIA